MTAQKADRPNSPPIPVLVLAGPTGVGKTALSLKLAKKLGGEVVSADAMQVYRGLDIGTAKIPLAEREGIPHHLIDIRSIQEGYNAAEFALEAKACCQDIYARGAYPIVAGGSGFYIQTLIYGPPNGPPSAPEVRQALEAELAALGSATLYARLRAQDPTYAATLTENDRQKMVRALEIISLTGKQVSAFSWKERKPDPSFQFHCFFLHLERPVLYQRIDQRCLTMRDMGLVEEVRQFKEPLALNPSAKQAIGYRQTLEFLERGESDEARFISDFQTASRRYAKRQMTWFRQQPLFTWLDASDLEATSAAILGRIQPS
ncbi:MAG: miaA [Chlamydiales bacterium]|nr:miaA [Chlamydiales bacterium]